MRWISWRPSRPDLIICDLEMSEMNGLTFVERFRATDTTTPILIVSGTYQMTDIARVLRLGMQDVLLKPVEDFPRLRETGLGYLYPDMFTSKVDEEKQLFQDWDALSQHPGATAKLLKQLQPLVQLNIAQCRVNYRQLTMAEQPGLLLYIAALSNHYLVFYLPRRHPCRRERVFGGLAVTNAVKRPATGAFS